MESSTKRQLAWLFHSSWISPTSQLQVHYTRPQTVPSRTTPTKIGKKIIRNPRMRHRRDRFIDWMRSYAIMDIPAALVISSRIGANPILCLDRPWLKKAAQTTVNANLASRMDKSGILQFCRRGIGYESATQTLKKSAMRKFWRKECRPFCYSTRRSSRRKVEKTGTFFPNHRP